MRGDEGELNDICSGVVSERNRLGSECKRAVELNLCVQWYHVCEDWSNLQCGGVKWLHYVRNRERKKS